MPHVVADDQVTCAREAFAHPAVTLELVPAHEIERSRLMSADALIVRSTTRVDAELVRGTPVRFVGSATVGHDHVDHAALAREGITFAGAPGSSATSVTQFTLACLVITADRLDRLSSDSCLAVVGCGMIGERVARAAERLGMDVIRYDPPLAETTPDRGFSSITELARADFVTLHVPLVREGPHRTHHLVCDRWLDHLRPGCVLLNTSRGSVVHAKDVAAALRDGRLGGAAFDVFPHEPLPPRDLLERATFVSPHVAGRSLEGMIANTRAVQSAFMEAFDLKELDTSWTELPAAPPTSVDPEHSLSGWIHAAWPQLAPTDRELRASATQSDEDRARTFLRLRHSEPLRRDLTSLCQGTETDTVARFLAALRD